MDIICEYYANYTDDMPIKLQLRKYNETDFVSISGSSTADIVIRRPIECSPTQSPSPSPTQSSTQSTTQPAITSGIIAAIILAILTILAVVGAIGAILVYQRKTIQKMKKNE